MHAQKKVEEQGTSVFSFKLKQLNSILHVTGVPTCNKKNSSCTKLICFILISNTA